MAVGRDYQALEVEAASRQRPRFGGESLIVCDNLVKIYKIADLEVVALQGLDLVVDQGEFIAIVGASGSGKSTLMNLLGCLDTPTSGRYLLNGTAVETLDDAELAAIRNKEIGFVFQTFNLLPRTTALGNVELPLIYSGMPRKERRERAQEALVQVGLGDRMDHQPNELSGGQRQRVAIARALVNRPSILLADEPTGNLDSKNGDAVMKLLDELHADGATICMVTHDPRFAECAKRRIAMFDGQVVDEETLEELRAQEDSRVGMN